MDISINTTQSKYKIYLDCIALKNLNEFIASKKEYKNIIVITDSNVDHFIGNSFNLKNYKLYKYVIEAGEKSKNIETYYKIIRYLTSIKVDRHDLIIALGGGVVGDLAGFVASTYMRGVDYIQIPTSLLAMVDSSIGSKTAINTEDGKNLIGSFYNPRAVFIDFAYLKTLPQKEFLNGLSETIKASIIKDRKLFELIIESDLNNEEIIKKIVKRSIEIKKEIVERDLKETKERQVLNFGHTIGHALEKLSDYTLPHGYGVAIGMAMITRGYYNMGKTDERTYKRVEEILRKYHLPTHCSYSAEELYSEILKDKKSNGDKINIIYPKLIGDCRIDIVDKSNLLEVLKHCL